MNYQELKNKLGKQQYDTLNLIERAGSRGVNTVDFRNHEYIQMPTTRVLEINRLLKQNSINKKILKRTERNRTATYYLADFDWSNYSLFDETPLKAQPSEEKKAFRWVFRGNTAYKVSI